MKTDKASNDDGLSAKAINNQGVHPIQKGSPRVVARQQQQRVGSRHTQVSQDNKL